MNFYKLCIVACSCFCFTLSRETVDVRVYSKLTEGYKTFRIPCLARSANGTLLAFAEGRVPLDRPPVGNMSTCYGAEASLADGHCVDKDIVVKRSYDGGMSWSGPDVLTKTNKTYFYSNVNTALDAQGRIYLIYSRCSVDDYYGNCVDVIQLSDNNGESFTSPVYLSHHGRIGGPTGGWVVRYAIGKPFQGRIIVPKQGTLTTVLYSDDRGLTWKYVPGISNDQLTGEAAIAEVSDGSLVAVMRYGYMPVFFRSMDGGMSWTRFNTSHLINPNCEMSLTTFASGKDDEETKLLLSHANTNTSPSPNGRQNMTIHMSSDGGLNWVAIADIYNGPSAYSSTLQISSTTAACLYERSEGAPPVAFDSINIAFVPVN
ncbi:sialidase-1-like [Corticium candelabrum]|uniref:sialidase-1-like n=1 Tax=Corticium candelabrum TaxID=121492 RepID=UPI002E274305|nr:sialidase-1-like [Corticium candelabrum]